MKVIIFNSALAALIFACTTSVNGQSLTTPPSINSAGLSSAQSNGSMHFTVGELVVALLTDSDGNCLGSGITTGAVITDIEELSVNNMELTLYPNPTSEWLNIDFAEPLKEAVFINLLDDQGRSISSENYPAGQSRIQLNANNWAPGNYFIHIRSNKNEAGATYKFIKVK